MKIAVINKSDSTGGAAVVSRRLTEALRREGADARMVVVEKLTGHDWVELAATPRKSRIPFLKERLGVFLNNGLNRDTLFKIDTGACGLPLWKHPFVREADAILLNWVNQGMLSTEGVEELADLGKPLVWTMHDMWCMTGVCHHAAQCRGYEHECRSCPLLGSAAARNDLAHRTWSDKRDMNWYAPDIRYVAVSNWLARKAESSTLLGGRHVSVIPNAFTLPDEPYDPVSPGEGKVTLLFGAARLDDPIKGLPELKLMTRILRATSPTEAERMEIVTFGNVKHDDALSGFGIPHRHLGVLQGEEAVAAAYRAAHIVVSSSHFETLPGTLVEAQAYGCVPVSFDQGGQADIVTDGETGFLARRHPNSTAAARLLADKVTEAVAVVREPDRYRAFARAMRANVEERFSSQAVARAYLRLITESRK